VVETLPNANDARRFANRHPGRVFLAGYADLRDDAMVWSDQASRSDRRTVEEDQTRYTVTLNQYRGHCHVGGPWPERTGGGKLAG